MTNERKPPIGYPDPPNGIALLERLGWYSQKIADGSPGGMTHADISAVAAQMVIADAIRANSGTMVELNNTLKKLVAAMPTPPETR